MKKEQFISACIQVHNEFKENPPRLIGRNHVPRVKLKPIYSRYASQYLYHRKAYNVNYYSTEHIFRLCKLLNVYVNDIISLKISP
jgi:hypothetical protein